jgi:hypothetical protein
VVKSELWIRKTCAKQKRGIPFLFSIKTVERHQTSHPNIIPARSRRSGPSCGLPRVPHLGLGVLVLTPIEVSFLFLFHCRLVLGPRRAGNRVAASGCTPSGWQWGGPRRGCQCGGQASIVPVAAAQQGPWRAYPAQPRQIRQAASHALVGCCFACSVSQTNRVKQKKKENPTRGKEKRFSYSIELPLLCMRPENVVHEASARMRPVWVNGCWDALG